MHKFGFKLTRLCFVSLILFSMISKLTLTLSVDASVKNPDENLLRQRLNQGFPVHNINSQLDYRRIQDALDANETRDGHIILVDTGIYYENVVVNKSVIVLGEDAQTTIIDGNGTVDSVVTMTVDGVKISGFTLRNGEAGILIDQSEYNKVTGNIVVDNFSGIVISGCPSCPPLRGNHISRNNVENNNIGITVLSSKNAYIFHNTFSGNVEHSFLFSSDDFWDDGYPSGGNFWSGYGGFDNYGGFGQNETGADGIGDTVYPVNASVYDKYPLMGGFSSFNATQGFRVNLVSNSTIHSFRYNQTGNSINFHVEGDDGQNGFCRVCIPHDLIYPPHEVLINDGETAKTYFDDDLYDNGTHRWLYFMYRHSTHEVLIIPEFSKLQSCLVLSSACLLSAIMFRTMVRRKKFKA